MDANSFVIDKFLTEIHACQDAKTWAEGKTWQEIFDTCHRGDWLLWLFKRANTTDPQEKDMLIDLALHHAEMSRVDEIKALLESVVTEIRLLY